MRAIAIWTFSTLLLSATATRAAEDAAAIVDKAIKAVGGEENLAKYKAEQWKTQGSIELMGMKMAFTADYFFQKPGQLRLDVAMEFGGQKITFSAATDGKAAWQKSGDMLEDMPEKKAKGFRDQVHSMRLCQILPLKDKDNTLTVVDEIKVDGKEAVGVKVTKKGERDVTLYFDKKTSHLVKSTSEIWDEFIDKDVKQENYITGWKEKGGTWYFDKLVIKRDGKDFITEEMSDQKSLEKLDPKLFAKP